MTEHECNNHSHECIARHEALDVVKDKVGQIFDVICGGLEPENSMKTKVDVLFSERHERRAFNQKIILTFVISAVMLIFWCGQESASIKNHSERLDKIEQRLDAIGK